MNRMTILAATAIAGASFANISSAYAEHSWAGYHWERTVNPKQIDLGDNLDSKWSAHLQTASDQWNDDDNKYTGIGKYPKVIQTGLVNGQSNRNCKATSGRVEVCNASYGFNGWLGIAQIWVTGSHITQGVAKMNDSYFDTSTYNTVAWRNLVMCQEVAHTFGLDHQDENFYNANLNTCMDYTNNPDSNQAPNEHDFEELAAIYEYADVTQKTVRGRGNGKNGRGFEFATYVRDEAASEDWGRPVAFTNKGQPRLFVKDLGNGNKRITHVFWVEDAPAHLHE